MSAHAPQAAFPSPPEPRPSAASGAAAEATQQRAGAASIAAESGLTPSQRLALSRERLRRAMSSDGSGRGRKQGSSEGPSDASQTDTGGGAFSTFVQLATHWWESHPLREAAHIASNVAAPAAEALLAPMARRHPWRLVLIAAGVGGAIVWARPWRWLPQAALSSALVSSIWPRGGLSRWLASGGLISLLTSTEVRHWLATLLAQHAQHAQGADPASTAEPTARAASSDGSTAAGPAAAHAPAVPSSPSAGEPSDAMSSPAESSQGQRPSGSAP